MPADVLARWLQVPGDLPVGMSAAVDTVSFTREQLVAIERREGDLFLAAGAGSGKTSVLVERFVRAVIEDEIDVRSILTITFTDKAAAEMRERIRKRLRQLGALDAARATEGAFISTIHGFCARLLRAAALPAGLDPAFTVLDEPEARRIADRAFDDALSELAGTSAGAELISSYGAFELRAAIQAVYAQLRSRGEARPRLAVPLPGDDLDAARRALGSAADEATAELGAIRDPASRVVQALARLERCAELVSDADPWPGDLEALRLPTGNGAALTTPVCVRYREAVDEFIRACGQRWAHRAGQLLDRLLEGFGARYEQRKREVAGVDFEDLELRCRDLLRAEEELRDRYRERFARVMVDELQDTNAVQLELIDLVSRGNQFTVGDAQQAIYSFRHADVELFERRGARLDEAGARATLRTNFRSRAEILEVVNRAFGAALGEGFMALVPGREEEPAGEALVELVIADKGAEWAGEGLAAPWRLAEAHALAARVGELIDQGARPRDVVVLLRATTDMRAYERALEARGVPTYVIGGRGYWSHPQVVDLLAYLRTLANPRDEEALYGVLASPMVGATLDSLVLLGDAARRSDRDPWWVLNEAREQIADLSDEDARRFEAVVALIREERAAAARKSVEELIERMLERTGYDLEVLAMPGGQRRLANVRKLMRLAREQEASGEPTLRGFLELASARSREGEWGEAPESEAPVESESLEAVRLMTIHRAKGLEFEIVCVADLGRGPRWPGELLRVGRDGRLGLRLARPGTGRQVPVLDYDALGEEQRSAAAQEERRLFYVAATRARERLIFSGAANLGGSWTNGGSGVPIGWLAPALVPDLVSRIDEGSGQADGVRFTLIRPENVREPPASDDAPPAPATAPLAVAAPAATERAAPIASLSYSSLAGYQRCGYRFYAERVLRLPPTQGAPGGAEAREGSLSATERGIAVHKLLEGLDFRRPLIPAAEAIAAAATRPPSSQELDEIGAMLERFAGSELCRRLGRATRVRREQRFAFPLERVLITGALDVVAAEPGGRLVVVDYKTDRLDGADPAAVVAEHYASQRLIYAIAALRAGAERADVVHVFLEEPERPLSETLDRSDLGPLERKLRELVAGVARQQFTVTETPYRGLCSGCPAEGGLCSWPLEMTRRDSPDRLL